MAEQARDQSPLLGVVLCCTSIPPEQRTQLAAVALQMGATHKLDLTSDVTHLIVGNIDTQKYKYVAKERQDIKVLKPEWLEAVRASWIQGGETDVPALEKEYHLPPLFDLQVCVTGFDDLTQRNDIQQAVTANGATYHGDLTKSVTHLIAANPAGRKYEYAGLWRIKTVSIEWLHQSLDRGMALDETLYNPLMPPEERGKGAVTEHKVPSPVLGKRPRPAEPQAESVEPGIKRKLRRSASTRLGSQSGNLWADIGPVNPQQNQTPTPQPEDSDLRRSRDHSQVDHAESQQDDSFTSRVPELLKGHRDKSVFANATSTPSIFVHGFDDRRMAVLSSLLTSEGAKVLSDKDLEARSAEPSIMIIVPHAPEVAASPEFYGVAACDQLISRGIAFQSDQVVTEFWIEQCLFRHRVMAPTEAPLCEPFKSIPIPGFQTLTICPTSFSGCDLLHFSKATKLMGAKYDEYLRKDTSVLVCRDASANPGKLRYALENSIPVVSAIWFYDCVKNGTLLSFDDYELSTARQSQKQSQPCFYHPITNPRRHAASGRSFKSSLSRPATHRLAPPGRLDLAPAFPAEKGIAKGQSRNQKKSGVYNDSFDTAYEPVGVLKDVSLSKQNSQQGRERSASAVPPEKYLQKSQAISRSKVIAVGAESFPNFHDEESLGDMYYDAADDSLSSRPDVKQFEFSASPSGKPRDTDSLKTALAAVLARRAPVSAGLQDESSLARGQTGSLLRRQRTLGRAASNGSHALSRTHSLDGRSGVGHEHLEIASGGAAENDTFDPELETADKTKFRSRYEALENAMFRPSQALSYEDPEALAMKEQLMKRINGENGADSSELDKAGDAKGKGERVQSIGVVENSSAMDDKRGRGMRRK